MKLKSTRLFLLLLPALLLPVLSVTTVEAARPTVSTGHFTTMSSVLLTNRTHNGISVLTFHTTVSLTGILTGTLEGRQRSVVNTRTLTVTLHARAMFTGTANGQSGTLVLTITATGVAGGMLKGRFTVSHGTGDLTGFVGHGTFTQPAGAVSGDYTLTWHISDSD